MKCHCLKWILLVGCLAGCSSAGDGVRLYQVSGKVTFQGKPVSAGVIFFDPDAAAGNSGPQGSAEIVNGTYNTATKTGKGIAGGPMVVTMTGWNSAPANAEQLSRDALFTDYVVRKEFANKNSEMDFEIPAEAAKPTW